jgi:cytochrome oxidase Cu insertion factor (SCO1/SenC/PrrC family)
MRTTTTTFLELELASLGILDIVANMARQKSFAAIVASMLSFCILVAAGQTTSDQTGPGVKVGDRAPSFKLKDQKGKEQSLDSLLKKGTVALVFYRSADW